MAAWIDAVRDILETYLQTGGMVMVPLTGLCLVMWMLIVNRLFFFRRLRFKKMSPAKAWEHIREDRLPDPAHYGDMTALLTAELLHRRGSGHELTAGILDETAQWLKRRMAGYLDVIGVLAAIAPLLGLLGTVTGMMATFDVIAVFGTGNAKAMARGISEALITTQTGLLIAIPGLYMKGLLDRRARSLQQGVTAVQYYLRQRLGYDDDEDEDDR